jgi:hypothetical protein
MQIKLSSKRILLLTSFTLLLWNIVNGCLAQTPAEKMQKVLTVGAGFTEEELKALNQGEIIAKLLSVKDEREVAIGGAIRLTTPLEVSLKAFQDTLSRQNKGSVISSGDFSQTPVPDDLKTLTLDKGDIEKLKICQTGNCDLRLSAQMIERFQKEIDWNATDASTRANLLFRQILLDYVQDYLSRGNEALIEYNHQRNPIKLREEQESLLGNLLWINEFAPEFKEYLKSFPRSDLPSVRNTLTWTKIKFGLKPVIIITQTVTYTIEREGVSQILSVSKQIYASRYFDSSLGLTALIKFPENENSYLFYTNHSRSSALEGMLSNFKREIVEREALEKLKPLLQNTKFAAESSFKRSQETDESPENRSLTERLIKSYWFWGILIAILLITAVGVRRQKLKQ